MRPLASLSDGSLDRLQALVVMALLGAATVALPMAYQRAWSLWRDEPLPRRRALAGALGAGAALRLLVAPKWIVTMYIGYHLTQQAIDLFPISHYGVGSSAFYHALFGVFPLDHATLLWANSVVGALTLPLVATFAWRALGDPRAGVAMAALVALGPMFIKNDNSDANHVPCLWWLFGGLVLWEEFLATRRRAALAGAAALLALAATARPEMPALVPMIVGALTLAWWPPRRTWRDPRVYAALGLAALCLAPQVEHVLREMDNLRGRSSLPGLEGDRGRILVERYLHQNSVFDGTLYPTAALLLAVVGLVASRAPLRMRVTLALLSIPVTTVYSLDLCRANMARVHVPGALLVTTLAAAGLVFVWDALAARGARVALAGRVALVVALAATAARTAALYWAPTNEQAEEDFLRASVARLPREGAFTFVRIGHPDRIIIPGVAEFTHDHWPEYLIVPPEGPGRVTTIAEFNRAPDFSAPVYFYLGTRCYSRMRPPSRPAPRGDNLQEPCAAMRARYALEPVLERAVPNRRDVWLEYYGDGPTLRLGLYRVRARTP